MVNELYFVKNLKELRQEKAVSQNQIAKKLNIAVSTYANWEQGRTEPNIIYMKQLANYFNVSIDYLVGNANDEGLIVMQNELSADENYLIDLVRQLNMKDKNTIYELVELMVQAKKNKNGS